jgi:hypothetical protein
MTAVLVALIVALGPILRDHMRRRAKRSPPSASSAPASSASSPPTASAGSGARVTASIAGLLGDLSVAVALAAPFFLGDELRRVSDAAGEQERIARLVLSTISYLVGIVVFAYHPFNRPGREPDERIPAQNTKNGGAKVRVAQPTDGGDAEEAAAEDEALAQVTGQASSKRSSTAKRGS